MRHGVVPALRLLQLVWAALLVAIADAHGATAFSPAGNGKTPTLAPISYPSDGLKITGLLGKPAGDGPFPWVIVHHGGFDPASSVASFAEFFVNRGFVALASDYRGCGVSTIVGGTPEEIPDARRERSALHAADKIECPVFLIYSDGDRDDAVPTDQGRRMNAALRAAGDAATTLLLIPEVNHGLNPKTWATVLTQSLEFIERHTT